MAVGLVDRCGLRTYTVDRLVVLSDALAGIADELVWLSLALVLRLLTDGLTASICFSAVNCFATCSVFFRSFKSHRTQCTLPASPYFLSSSVASSACSSFCDSSTILDALCWRRWAVMPNPIPAVPPVTI